MKVIELDAAKIRSYQTLVYKNGAKTFKTPQYEDYERELYYSGLINVKERFENVKLNVDLFLIGTDNNIFNSDRDNLAKPIYDILEKYKIIDNDKNIFDGRIKKSVDKSLKMAKIIIEIRELEEWEL